MEPIVKIIRSVIPTIIIGIAGYFFTKEYDFSLNLGLIFIIVLAVLWIFSIVIVTLRNQKEILQKENNDKQKEIDKLNDLISPENRNRLEGMTLLFMALTQHPAEPLKISMLERAVEKENLIAGLILANIYEYGIEKNGEILLEENVEKAFSMYSKVSQFDSYGICNWMIGAYFQNDRIEEAHKHNENKRLEIAKQYFEKSLEKNFPKAYNSLGGLISGEKLGYDRIIDREKMEGYFRKASELGDNYGKINLGNYLLDTYYLTYQANNKEEDLLKHLVSAKKQFEDAATMNSPEAFVKLGMIYLEMYNFNRSQECVLNAQKQFERSISFGRNQFAGAGYFLIGNLLKRYPELADSNSLKSIITFDRFNDLTIECFVRSYEIFNDLLLEGKAVNGENRRYFKVLSSTFKDIEIDPLKYQLKKKSER